MQHGSKFYSKASHETQRLNPCCKFSKRISILLTEAIHPGLQSNAAFSFQYRRSSSNKNLLRWFCKYLSTALYTVPGTGSTVGNSANPVLSNFGHAGKTDMTDKGCNYSLWRVLWRERTGNWRSPGRSSCGQPWRGGPYFTTLWAIK